MDLPGIGTITFPDLEIYCEKVELETYDTFLIFTASRFTQLELDLAKKIKEMDKSLFLVRTKVDLDEYNESRKKCHNTNVMLNRIRVYCYESVQDLKIPLNEIFLINNHDMYTLEFRLLVKAILEKLHVYQKDALTLSLKILSKDFVKRKVDVFRGKS